MITAETANVGGCISTKDFFGELTFTAYPRNMLTMPINNRIISIKNPFKCYIIIYYAFPHSVDQRYYS